MAYKPFEDDSIMPFGKHKGTRMIELPINYLMWILDKADEGTLKDYALKNEKWIREEARSGSYNRPVRASGVDRNPVETKPQPPNKLTATEFICNELNCKLDEVDVGDTSIGMSIEIVARLAERYKNYFNGTPNLKPLPKIDQPKGEIMPGWGEESFEQPKDPNIVTQDDIPF